MSGKYSLLWDHSLASRSPLCPDGQQAVSVPIQVSWFRMNASADQSLPGGSCNSSLWRSDSSPPGLASLPRRSLNSKGLADWLTPVLSTLRRVGPVGSSGKLWHVPMCVGRLLVHGLSPIRRFLIK